MPQDIGPELHLIRPRSHVGFVTSRGSAGKRMITRPQTTSTGGTRGESRSDEQSEYHIELLEYEWPDLPPIIDMKDAVTRRRVSQGINYLLPVDKGRNSIDNKYRTDLRAMFQEPYAAEGSSYDDNRVVQSAKIHFRTNTADTKWSKRHIKAIPVHLNSESEKARRLYAQSAPAGGRSKDGSNSSNVRQRSSLFLPIKAQAHPESQRLRQEVDQIIKSVQEDNDEYDPEAETEALRRESTVVDAGEKRKSLAPFRHHSSGEIADIKLLNVKRNKLTAEEFDNYDQLKKSKPPKPKIPEQFVSSYLSASRNQEIWDWLHYGETISEFEYFLSVCG